jgi:group I intron endonuclease
MSYARYNTFLLYLGEIMISGIYRIYSIATGESYYGSTNRLDRRFTEHRSAWKSGKGNKKIRSLLDKYGQSNFEFQILEYCLPEYFEEKEKKYIESDDNRLNVWILPFSSKGCNLGDNVKGKKFIGHKHTEENKKKHGETMREYYKSHDGYWKGKSIPEDTKKKVSDGLKKYFSQNIHPNKGKTLSEETKKKISETLKKRGVL